MDVAGMIRRGRDVARRYMEATGTTVTVGRNTGALDPETFDPILTPVYPDPAWPEDHPLKAGPARVQTNEAVEKEVEVGGGTVVVQRYAVHLPVGTFAPKIDDVVTVTACGLDPNLVGREFIVRGLLHKSAATAYRLLVDDDNGFA